MGADSKELSGLYGSERPNEYRHLTPCRWLCDVAYGYVITSRYPIHQHVLMNNSCASPCLSRGEAISQTTTMSKPSFHVMHYLAISMGPIVNSLLLFCRNLYILFLGLSSTLTFTFPPSTHNLRSSALNRMNL